MPNLMLVFVTSIAFIRGDKVGLLTGFVSGFLVDIFFGAILGFYALLFMYIGFFVGKQFPSLSYLSLILFTALHVMYCSFSSGTNSI